MNIAIKKVDAAASIEPALLTVDGLCKYLSIGRTRAYELLSDRIIPARRLGGRTMILRSDADAYLRQLPEYCPKTVGR